MKGKLSNFIAFDIGSSKIAAIAANINKQGEAKVITHLLHYSDGFKSGSIVDLATAENSIVSAIYALEKECDKSIKEATISLSGSGIKSYYVSHKIKLGNQAISKNEIKKLIQKALADFKIKDREIIHYFPLEFILDQDNVVDNPTGMYARELSCQLHIITANSLMLINLTNCLAKCHVEVKDVMLSIYSSALACLTEDEKQLGSIIIEFGSHVTSFGVFLDGKIIYVGSVNIGSFHITSDIAKAFSISIDTAEKIKILYGNAMPSVFGKDNTIRIDEFEADNAYHSDLSITSGQLSEVIYKRSIEIFKKIKEQYDLINMDHLIARRMVITGGGANLQGIKNIVADIFHKQVRIAKPEILPGFVENYNMTMYSSAIGMIKSRSLKYQKDLFKTNEENSGWFKKTFMWFKENI